MDHHRAEPIRLGIVLDVDDTNPDLLFIWAGIRAVKLVEELSVPRRLCPHRERRRRWPLSPQLVTVLTDPCQPITSERCQLVLKQHRRQQVKALKRLSR